jgi:hypothetical protein
VNCSVPASVEMFPSPVAKTAVSRRTARTTIRAPPGPIITNPANAKATSASGTYGVKGISNSAANSSTHPAGVYGETTTSNGEAYGLYGTTAATSGYAVYASGDSKTDGNHEVTGSVSAGNVGASAYLSTDQSIPDSTLTAIEYDQTEADHFGGFNTSTGEYTVQEDGDYHVDFAIKWSSILSDVTVDYSLVTSLNGIEFIERITETSNHGRCFSKTVFSLTSGDTITAQVLQFSGGSRDVDGNNRGDTYMTIHKVG